MSSGKNVFVTGASGMLGAEIVADLLANGHRVIALINAQREIKRNSGQTIPAIEWRTDGPLMGSVSWLRGDIRKTDFGLSPNTHRHLREQTDLVVHSAAVTDFGRPWEVYESVNVGGTRNVLQFAAGYEKKVIPLIHVSTAYVCGKRSGRILETELDVGQSFGNPYEESKFNAELLVRAAGKNGLPYIIARPSVIVGSSRDGHVRDFKTIYTVLKLVTEGRVRYLPGNYDATVDLVSVDFVSKSVAALAAEPMTSAGKTLHIASRAPVTMKDFSDVIAEYPNLRVARFVPPASFDESSLSPIERRYHERVISLFASYFTRRVFFSTELASELIPIQPVRGMPLLRKMISFAERVGYLGRLKSDHEAASGTAGAQAL